MTDIPPISDLLSCRCSKPLPRWKQRSQRIHLNLAYSEVIFSSVHTTLRTRRFRCKHEWVIRNIIKFFLKGTVALTVGDHENLQFVNSEVNVVAGNQYNYTIYPARGMWFEYAIFFRYVNTLRSVVGFSRFILDLLNLVTKFHDICEPLASLVTIYISGCS